MSSQSEYGSVAELVESVDPLAGQDCDLVFHVYTDRTLGEDETITGMTLIWTLFLSPEDATAILVKTASISTPYATVTLTAANTAALTVGTEYLWQLWRNDSGNVYPLTGYGTLTPRQKPPLS